MKSLYLEQEILVSTHDIDFAGHVNNIVYLRWLEDMRLQMFERYCPLKQFIDQGISPVLVSSEIHYKKAIRLFQKPVCKMWLSGLSLSTLHIDAEIHLDNELCTKARHTGVFVDIERMKPIRVPKVFQEAVKHYEKQALCSELKI